MKYTAKMKSPGLWYVDGPGWGEPADKYCDSEELAKISADRMSEAYRMGYRTYQAQVLGSLDKILNLNGEPT